MQARTSMTQPSMPPRSRHASHDPAVPWPISVSPHRSPCVWRRDAPLPPPPVGLALLRMTRRMRRRVERGSYERRRLGFLPVTHGATQEERGMYLPFSPFQLPGNRNITGEMLFYRARLDRSQNPNRSCSIRLTTAMGGVASQHSSQHHATTTHPKPRPPTAANTTTNPPSQLTRWTQATSAKAPFARNRQGAIFSSADRPAPP